jgi:hypothetical protein
MRTIWSEWTRDWWLPFELGLVLSVFGHHSRSSASPPDSPGNHLIWVNSIRTVPLLIDFPLELLFRRVYTYCTWCAFVLVYVSYCNQYSLILFCNYLILHCSVLCQTMSSLIVPTIVWILSNCSLFWYRKCIPGNSDPKTRNINHLRVNLNILHHKICLLSS